MRIFFSGNKLAELPDVAASHWPTDTYIFIPADTRLIGLHGHSSKIRCKFLHKNGIRTARELCAVMRKTGVFAHQDRRSARIKRSMGGRAERQPRVADDGRLNPARVGQPDQPDDLAAVGRKLLIGLSFHEGDSFRGKMP